MGEDDERRMEGRGTGERRGEEYRKMGEDDETRMEGERDIRMEGRGME